MFIHDQLSNYNCWKAQFKRYIKLKIFSLKVLECNCDLEGQLPVDQTLEIQFVFSWSFNSSFMCGSRLKMTNNQTIYFPKYNQNQNCTRNHCLLQDFTLYCKSSMSYNSNGFIYVLK